MLVTQSCPTLCDPMNCSQPGSLCPWDSPGKNTGVGGHALLQGIFLTQGSNLDLLQLLRCRQILYHLSQEGSPRILEWVAMPSSRGSTRPRDRTWVSRIAGRFSTLGATREALHSCTVTGYNRECHKWGKTCGSGHSQVCLDIGYFERQYRLWKKVGCIL